MSTFWLAVLAFALLAVAVWLVYGRGGRDE